MSDIMFPVVEGKSDHWPSNKAVCPMCGEKKVWEPHSMAILSAGALLMDRKANSGGPSDDMDGYLHLDWHGAHDNGQGDDREICCTVNIVEGVIGGQGDLYFCSTVCLRKFLNQCVDELEDRIKQERAL